jgi:uncharacterized protein (TIGR03435 family)
MKPLLLLAALCAARAQGPTFEVVSIKPAAPDQHGAMSRGGPGTRTPSTWMCRNMSLNNLIYIAYDTRVDGQLVAPGWTEEFRFDVDAKVPSGAPKDSLRPMLREMLADRFALKVHTQPREVQGYELVIAKNGPKIAEAAPESSTERPQPGPDGFYATNLGPDGFPAPIPGVPGVWVLQGRARVQWYRITTAKLADNLISRVGKPIEDGSGLKGLYDISLYWLMNPRSDMDPSGPDLFEALQQQLGLKLQPKKITIQAVVVDHVDKVPTAN